MKVSTVIAFTAAIFPLDEQVAAQHLRNRGSYEAKDMMTPSEYKYSIERERNLHRASHEAKGMIQRPSEDDVDGERDVEHRDLFDYQASLNFEEECRRKPTKECIETIRELNMENPHWGLLNIQTRHVRQATDKTYYKVALRVDKTMTYVTGVHNDGVVRYPFKWKKKDENGNVHEYDIGPWDCNTGLPLTFEQCCTFIKDSVPGKDINGNELTCHISYPPGYPPVNNRVILVENPNGRVNNAPIVQYETEPVLSYSEENPHLAIVDKLKGGFPGHSSG